MFEFSELQNSNVIELANCEALHVFVFLFTRGLYICNPRKHRVLVDLGPE